MCEGILIGLIGAGGRERGECRTAFDDDDDDVDLEDFAAFAINFTGTEQTTKLAFMRKEAFVINNSPLWTPRPRWTPSLTALLAVGVVMATCGPPPALAAERTVLCEEFTNMW